MANLARFTINGVASSIRGYDASASQVLTFALEGGAANLVGRWALQVYGPVEPDAPLASKAAPLLTLVGATSGEKVDAATTGSTITTTCPAASGHSWLIRSLVDGGLDARGRPDPNKVFERMVAIRTTGGQRKVIATESTQYTDGGWADAVNDAVDAAAAGGGGGGGSGSTDITVDAVITSPGHPHTGTAPIDGVTLTAGVSKVLDTAHANPVLQGPWLTQAGAWIRPPEYDADPKVAAALAVDFRVLLGAIGVGSRWRQTTGATLLAAKAFEYIPIQPVTNLRKGIVNEISTFAGIPITSVAGTALATKYAELGITLSSCGAHANGTVAGSGNDDAPAFALAIAKCAITGARTIVLDQGRDYLIKSKLDLRELSGVSIVGPGHGYTTKSRLIFDIANRAPDTTSVTSNTPSATGNYTFATPAHTPLVAGVTASAQSRGSTARIEGFVVSDSGTSIVITVQHAEQLKGSGAHTDWDLVNETENFNVGFHSSYACGINGVTIVSITTVGTLFRGTQLTFEHSPAGADTGLCFVYNCGFFGLNTDGTNLHTSLRLNNCIGAEVKNCNFQRSNVGIVAGNGPIQVENCYFINNQDTGIQGFAYQIQVSQCTFEGVGEGPAAQRVTGVRVHGAAGPAMVHIHSNVFNDAGALSTGRGWIELNGVHCGHIHANYFGNDSVTMPAIYLANGCQGIKITANLCFTAAIVEFGGGSLNGSVHPISLENNWFNGLFANRVLGSNYSSFTFSDDNGGTFGNPKLPFIDVSFVSSTFGGRDVPGNISLSVAVNNNVGVTNALLRLTGPASAFTITGFTYAGAGDGQKFRMMYDGSQQLTLANDAATSTAAYRFDLPGGADIVIPAGGYYFLDFVRHQPGDRWRLASEIPARATVQAGVTTLVAGVSPAIAAVVKAGSRIVATVKTPAGTTNTVDYAALSADRSAGAPGSFKLTALLAAGTIDAGNTSTLDWIVHT